MRSLDHLAERGLVDAGVHLGRLTTYKLGGPARWYAAVSDRERLGEIAAAVAADPVPVLVLGRGSNLVVSDAGFDGLVIHPLGEFAVIEHRPDEIQAGCAVPLPRLARSSVEHGRLGLEFYVGIPGSVGGAVRQNAGCHGSDTAEWIRWAEVLDLETGVNAVREAPQLGLGYRHSDLADHEMVIAAGFGFRPGDATEGEHRMMEITRWRRQHQPGGTLNAGSVFKNPPGDAAGRIIDEQGLKGFRVGKVSVSERHANFFVAEEGASAAELHRLVATVQARVESATGVRLEPEIRFVGRFEDG